MTLASRLRRVEMALPPDDGSSLLSWAECRRPVIEGLEAQPDGAALVADWHDAERKAQPAAVCPSMESLSRYYCEVFLPCVSDRLLDALEIAALAGAHHDAQ